MSANEGSENRHDGLEKDESNNLVGIVCEGKYYEIPGMTDEDMQEIENYLLENRKNPLAAIKDELDAVRDIPVLREALIDRAYRDLRKHETTDSVTHHDVRDYLDTREGTIHSMWLCLKRKYPEMTQDQVKIMFAKVSTAEAQKKRDLAAEKTLARRAPKTFSRKPQEQPVKQEPDPCDETEEQDEPQSDQGKSSNEQDE